MPSGKRKEAKTPTFTGDEPQPISESLDTIAKRHGLKPASQALRQLDAPVMDEPSNIQQEPATPPAPQPEPESHAETVRDGRPAFAPVATGFMNVATHTAAGIKVNKSHDKQTVSLQFSDDRLPTREEKNLLECVGDPEGKPFAYQPARRQWERTDRENPGMNIIDGKRIAAQLAAGRAEGQGR